MMCHNLVSTPGHGDLCGLPVTYTTLATDAARANVETLRLRCEALAAVLELVTWRQTEMFV